MGEFFLVLAVCLLTTVGTAGGRCDQTKDCRCSGDTCSADWRREGLECSGCGRAYRGSVQYLHKTIRYTNYRTAHVLVEWDFKENYEPLESFRLLVDFFQTPLRLGETQPKRSCYCLPNNTRRFELITSENMPGPCAKVYDYPNINATVQLNSKEIKFGFVEDCWSVMGNRSLDVCGVQVPSPPVNVSAVLSVDSSTNMSTFTVEWSPPLYNNTPIRYYRVEYLPSKDDQPWLFTNKTSVTLQKKMDVLPTRVTVRAGDRISEPYKECLLEETVFEEGVLYFGSSAAVQILTTDTPPPPPPPPPPPTPPPILPYVIAPLVGVVVCTVVLITLVAVVVAFKRHPKPKRADHNFGITVPIDVPLIQPEAFRAIFIVASTEEDGEMQYKLRYLVHDLADNGIDPVYYEYERTSHGTESPAALGISQWVELQFQKCDLVLFAFTKRFLEEWKRESTDQLSPVVWSSRHVLDGLLPHQGNISKFGVVLMGEDCTIPPGLKRFQVFRLFNGDSATIHSEHLIRYILETPPYAPPRVSMSNHKPLSV